MNFKKHFNFLKRFFEPVLDNKKKSTKLLTESTLGYLWFDLSPLLIIPFFINLLQKNDSEKLLNYSVIFIFMYLCIWTIHLFLRYWDFEAKYAYKIFLEKKYREKTILKEAINIEMIGTGKVQSIIQKGMYAWSEANWQILYQIPKTILGVVTGFYIVFQLGNIFILFFILALIFSTIFYYYFRKIQFFFQEKENEIDDVKNDNSVRIIMSRQEIVFSGKEKSEMEGLIRQNKLGLVQAKKMAKYDFLSDIFISGTGTLLPFLGIILFIILNKNIDINLSILLPFVYFSTRFAFTLYSSLWIIKQIFEHFPQIKAFWDFIDNVPQIKNYETGKKFVHKGGEVLINDVYFGYDTDDKNMKKEKEKSEEVEKKYGMEEKQTRRRVLENFNLKIEAGTKVALVGRSGSGKTTIAKLISGYLKVDGQNSGEILVDGQNLNEISLKSYYKYIGYLTQEPMVFDGTIRENLLYAVSEKVSEEEILEALRKAECLFIFQTKYGLETQIGEKGIRLSGGERQRLAIAKLFLKNPEIIILDEPTSALDSFSEDTISKSLEELFKGRTTIIIAHRLQTVKKADRILVLENGQIVEDGNHAELLSLGGHYAKMLEMQSGF